jgi:uncharacterized protein (TIGR02271 family)
MPMPDQHSIEAKAPVEPEGPDASEIVVPLFSEEISVSKRVVPKGRVRVSRVTRHSEELVDEILARERVEVERIPIDREVAVMPAVREDGDTIVIPIVEEALVIQRRLVLKEEVRIRRIRETEHHQERVPVLKQEATITRLPAENSAAGGGPPQNNFQPKET